jgi:general secretion pathway protein G
MLERIRAARKEESGFTLIELLIVVIVLGVLAAIVLFALGTFTKDSAAAACETDGKQVETANTAYFAKNNANGSIAQLVSAGYLKSAPKTDNYTIAIASGVVTGTLTAANGGTACYPAP